MNRPARPLELGECDNQSVRKPAASSSEPTHEHEHVVMDQWQGVTIRHAPRIGRFLWLAVVGGALLAVLSTAVAVATRSDGVSTGLGSVLVTLVVFALVFIGVGLALVGVFVLVLDRVTTRRMKERTADRATVLYHDLTQPTSDDPPRQES